MTTNPHPTTNPAIAIRRQGHCCASGLAGEMKRYRVTFTAPPPYLAVDVLVYADSETEAVRLAKICVGVVCQLAYTRVH
jgi:hypothetical protein